MKKYLIITLGLFAVFFLSTKTEAQTNGTKQKLAIFAPLYLDSAFVDDSTYRYAKNVFPKFINPGLEFYEGAQLALDSLNMEGAELEVFVYDTRSATESLTEQLDKAQQNGVSLILAHISAPEIKTFADAALKNSIPVINVNLPNDGGINGNPYFVLLNSTLRTQVEGIYRHLQKYYALDRLVVFRKKGSLEDRIKAYFDEFGKNTASVPLKLKYVDLPDSFTVNHLRQHLDTADQTICIAGSLDDNFGRRLVQQLASLKKQKFQAAIIGMPTWDYKDFTKPEFKGIEVTYGDPFYNSRVDKLSQNIIAWFNRVMFMRPSDMVFRGYETTWRYARMLMQYGRDIGSNLSAKQPKLFTDFDIQPVLNKNTMTLDYFENKKLYFLKSQDGIIKAVY